MDAVPKVRQLKRYRDLSPVGLLADVAKRATRAS